VRHTIAMTLLSNSQTDGDVSLEPVSVTQTGSAHSMSGMAAVGGFGVGFTGSTPSVTSAPVDTSRRSLKQRRRSSNIIRAPIASAEELSPSSPQGFTPSGPEAPNVHQPPVDTKYLNGHRMDVEIGPPRRDQAVHAMKARTMHISTPADSNDNIRSEDVAISGASHPKLSSHMPASKLGTTTNALCPSVSDDSPSYVIDHGLPASLPSLPGAVRRPDSFVYAMSDQLVLASEPRRIRAAQSPVLETQLEEEPSSIFEFSV